ncbi:hypothetical protein F2Q69_00027203 [Brassica cretica]|uniref:ORC6 second cyclin-like domain-containing protein n=1 Tax=Brassica cretica TaxID=69181 RepID=A0A8S9S936_BRACR|nr:hypothetical protein F2Q69_00027203 [Brassica cretica]
MLSESSRIKLNVKELAIQFGCVRIIKSMQNMLSLFLASLPVSRRANADFTRPLKVDKLRLVEVCGTSESEFSCVFTSMIDLCYDCVGVSKEKKDAKEVKGNRGCAIFLIYIRYGSYPLRGKYCHEMALRILLASIEVCLS